LSTSTSSLRNRTDGPASHFAASRNGFRPWEHGTCGERSRIHAVPVYPERRGEGAIVPGNTLPIRPGLAFAFVVLFYLKRKPFLRHYRLEGIFKRSIFPCQIIDSESTRPSSTTAPCVSKTMRRRNSRRRLRPITFSLAFT